MTAKHTPGPWHITAYLDEHDRRGRNVLVSEATIGARFRISAANFTPAYTVPCLADACLIAAAPDGLEANRLSLRNIEALIYKLPVKGDPLQKESLETWAAIVRAAIAKAEGREI